MTPALPCLAPIKTFAQQIEQEFVQGSAIDPHLFKASVQVVPDLICCNGEVIETPIHNALNWKFTRFGHQAKTPLSAALLRQEDGSTWQAKLSQPIVDRDKTKKNLKRLLKRGRIRDFEFQDLVRQHPDQVVYRKCETPKGNGSTAFLPPIPIKTWKTIARRNNLDELEPWLKAVDRFRASQLEKLNELSISNGSEPFSNSATAATESNSQKRHHNEFKGFEASLPKNVSDSSATDLSMLAELGLEELRSFVRSLPDSAIVPAFWNYVKDKPEIEIIFTEGGKKALCLLSVGHVAIALIGVNGGYSSHNSLERSLIYDVARFAVADRPMIVAFDQDADAKTKSRVTGALRCFSGLLQQAGCKVSVASWDNHLGKGVDDLIVNGGIEAWESAYSEALSLVQWQIWKRLDNRLTYPTNLHITTPDLSTQQLSKVPQEGIIAVCSAKATGKSKWIAKQVKEVESVLSAGHRITLQRNLAERLGLNYIGDCDKVEGRFIAGSAYALRLAFCVDSLLAIDPEQFRGCDLLLDEAVHVLQHLLTSPTCAKDGRRQVLLAIFHRLVQVARRVIIADADLNNDTLRYIQDRRGDNAPVFLIRNNYQPQGYAVRFIEAPNHSSVVTELLKDIAKLQSGQALFVCLDNKKLSRIIQQMIAHSVPDVLIWNINSDTSSYEFERSVVSNPDPCLLEAAKAGKRLVILATPAMGIGTSIEVQNIVQRVYGIFTGVSCTDADMSQALARVRQPVDRIVWCAKTGSNFSKISRSTNPLELKRQLQDKTTTTVSLIRSSLREDIAANIDCYDWKTDPNIKLYSRLAAEQNWAMFHLRNALLIRLKHEGHQVTVEQCKSDQAMRLLLAEIRAELQKQDAEAIVAARVLTLAEKLEIESRESNSPDDQLALTRFNLCDFYVIEPETLTTEFVLLDKEGRFRGEVANLEAQLYPMVEVDRTVKALEKQATWNQGICPWDIRNITLRQKIREEIGLNDFLNPDKEWTKYDLKPYADRAREMVSHIKSVLNFTISDKISDTQIVHQLLSQLGIKLNSRWSSKVLGHEKEKLRIYKLDMLQWKRLTSIVQRRDMRRRTFEKDGSPVSLNTQKQTGDPFPLFPQVPDEWFDSAVLTDVRQLWHMADSFAVQQELRKIIPIDVLRRAIAT